MSIVIPAITLPTQHAKPYLEILSSADFNSLLSFHDVSKLIEINLKSTKLKEEIVAYLKTHFPIITNTSTFVPSGSQNLIAVKLGTRELTGLRIAWVEHLCKHLK